MRCTMCLSLMCLTLASAATALAGTDPALSGEWVGTDADNMGKKIVLRGDGNGTLNGAAFRWDVPRAGVLRCQDGAETLELQYTLDGDRLRLVIGGQTASFKRSEAALKPPVRVPEPLTPLPPTGEPANPLAPAPEPDFARKLRVTASRSRSLRREATRTRGSSGTARPSTPSRRRATGTG